MDCSDGTLSFVQRRASFKGASFHVESTSESYGRRIVTHEFPLIDTPYLEDLGEKAIKISVTGYLVGSGWLAQRDALIAACRSPGLGTLIHPFYPTPMLMGCLSCNVSQSKDTLGKASVTLELVEQARFGGLAISLGYLGAQLEANVSLAGTASINVFAGIGL